MKKLILLCLVVSLGFGDRKDIEIICESVNNNLIRTENVLAMYYTNDMSMRDKKKALFYIEDMIQHHRILLKKCMWGFVGRDEANKYTQKQFMILNKKKANIISQ